MRETLASVESTRRAERQTATEGHNMSSILDLLRSTDGDLSVTIGGGFGGSAPRDSFVRGIYNALNNGADSVLVLLHNAPDDLVTLAQENENETDVVRVSTETYSRGSRKGERKSAKDTLAAIHRRNAANDNAPSDTYGRVSFPDDGAIHDATGELCGFLVVS